FRRVVGAEGLIANHVATVQYFPRIHPDHACGPLAVAALDAEVVVPLACQATGAPARLVDRLRDSDRRGHLRAPLVLPCHGGGGLDELLLEALARAGCRPRYPIYPRLGLQGASIRDEQAGARLQGVGLR